MPEQFVFCKMCGADVRKLRRHLTSSHSITMEDYYVVYQLEKELGYNPLCKLSGCNNKVKFNVSHRFFHEFCSRTCARKYQLAQPYMKEIVGNTFKKLWKSDDFRSMVVERNAKAAAKLKDDPNWVKSNKEAIERLWSDPNHVMKMAKVTGATFRKLNADPEFRRKSGYKFTTRGEYISPKCKTVVYYCSSYERKAMEKMDANPSVIAFEYEPIAIPYDRNGKKWNYYPDFLVTYIANDQKLIEVKAEYKLDDEINIAKFTAARKYCEINGISFDVWTETQL